MSLPSAADWDDRPDARWTCIKCGGPAVMFPCTFKELIATNGAAAKYGHADCTTMLICPVEAINQGAPMTRPVVPPPITGTVAPLGPNARAMLEGRLPDCRCGHRESGHSSAGCVRCQCDGWAPPVKQPSPRPTVLNLIADIAAGIRILRDRDGVPLTDAQIDERARNVVQGLLGSYEITRVAP